MMRWVDTVRIETPEQVEVTLELAGVGSRFVAWVLDVLIKLAVVVVVTGLVFVALVAAMSAGALPQAAVRYGLGAVGLSVPLFAVAYSVYFEVRRNGQSPGKGVAGIRVIREGGTPVDFRSACVRNALALVDFLPVLYLGGAVLALLSGRGQRLGDMAAGTLVVRERQATVPGEPEAVVGEWAVPDVVFTAEELARCAPADRHVLRSFFQRLREFEPPARRQLARRLAVVYRQKTGNVPAEPFADGARAMAYLASLYRDLEKVARQGG